MEVELLEDGLPEGGDGGHVVIIAISYLIDPTTGGKEESNQIYSCENNMNKLIFYIVHDLNL